MHPGAKVSQRAIRYFFKFGRNLLTPNLIFASEAVISCQLLNNIVLTNEKFFRFKMIDSPLCTFCQTEVESPEHLFFHCDITKSFWHLLFSWISEQNVISTSLMLQNVIFGVFNVVEDFHSLNHIILLAKYYIYNCKLNTIYPSLKSS